MDGQVTAGWFQHPKLGTINIYESNRRTWVYKCYSESGTRPLSTEKELDTWTWALCIPAAPRGITGS